jgi:hypothetical protein
MLYFIREMEMITKSRNLNISVVRSLYVLTIEAPKTEPSILFHSLTKLLPVDILLACVRCFAQTHQSQVAFYEKFQNLLALSHHVYISTRKTQFVTLSSHFFILSIKWAPWNAICSKKKNLLALLELARITFTPPCTQFSGLVP